MNYWEPQVCIYIMVIRYSNNLGVVWSSRCTLGNPKLNSVSLNKKFLLSCAENKLLLIKKLEQKLKCNMFSFYQWHIAVEATWFSAPSHSVSFQKPPYSCFICSLRRHQQAWLLFLNLYVLVIKYVKHHTAWHQLAQLRHFVLMLLDINEKNIENSLCIYYELLNEHVLSRKYILESEQDKQSSFYPNIRNLKISK